MDALGLLIAAKSLSRRSERFGRKNTASALDTSTKAASLLTVVLGCLAALYSWDFNSELHVPLFEKVVSAILAFLLGFSYFLYNALFGYGISALAERVNKLELMNPKKIRFIPKSNLTHAT
jgi:hypothetical protein